MTTKEEEKTNTKNTQTNPMKITQIAFIYSSCFC